MPRAADPPAPRRAASRRACPRASSSRPPASWRGRSRVTSRPRAPSLGRMAAAYVGVKIDRQRGGSSRGATCSSPVRPTSRPRREGPASSTTWRLVLDEPTGSSTWGSSRMCGASSSACPTRTRRCSSRRPCQRRSRPWPRACSKNPRSSTWGTRALAETIEHSLHPAIDGESKLLRTIVEADEAEAAASPAPAAGEAGRTAAGEARAHRVAARGQEAGARDRALQGFRTVRFASSWRRTPPRAGSTWRVWRVVILMFPSTPTRTSTASSDRRDCRARPSPSPRTARPGAGHRGANRCPDPAQVHVGLAPTDLHELLDEYQSKAIAARRRIFDGARRPAVAPGAVGSRRRR